MKKIVFFIFFLNTFFCFSQENEKKSYSFNMFNFTIINYYRSVIYRINYVFVKNEKYENYYLSINNELITATLNDFTLNKIFHFKLKKRVEKIVDLKQLDTAFYNPKSKLHCNCNSSEKSEKPIVEEIEYERDTTVSYTHLDVYKRQAHRHADSRSLVQAGARKKIILPQV